MPTPDINALLRTKYNQIDELSSNIFVARQQLQQFLAQSSTNPEQAKLEYYDFINRTVENIVRLYWDAILAIKASDQISTQEKIRQLLIRGGAVMYWQLYEKMVTNVVNDSNPTILEAYNLSFRFVQESSKPEWSENFKEICVKFFIHLASKLNGARLAEVLNEIAKELSKPEEPIAESESPNNSVSLEFTEDSIQESQPASTPEVLSEHSIQEPQPASTPEVLPEDSIQEPQPASTPEVLSEHSIQEPQPASTPEVLPEVVVTTELELDDAIAIRLSDEPAQEPEPDNTTSDVLSDQPVLQASAARESISESPDSRTSDSVVTATTKKKPKKKKVTKKEPLSDKLKTALSLQNDSGYNDATKLLRDNVANTDFMQKADEVFFLHIKNNATEISKPSKALIDLLKQIKFGYALIKYVSINLIKMPRQIREIAFSKISELDDSDFYRLQENTNIAEIIEQAKNTATSASRANFYAGIQRSFRTRQEYVRSDWGVLHINKTLKYLFDNEFKYSDENGLCTEYHLRLLANQKNEHGETPLMRCIKRAQFEPETSKIFTIINLLIQSSTKTLADHTFENSKTTLHYWAEYFNPAASLQYIGDLWSGYQGSLDLRGKRDHLLLIGGAEDAQGKNFVHALLEGPNTEEQIIEVFNTFSIFSDCIYMTALRKDKNGANIYSLLDLKPDYWFKFNELLNNKMPFGFFELSKLIHSQSVINSENKIEPPPLLKSMCYKTLFADMYVRLQEIPEKLVTADRIKLMLNDYNSIRLNAKKLYDQESKTTPPGSMQELVNNSLLEFFNIRNADQLNSEIEQSCLWHKIVREFKLNDGVIVEASQLHALKEILKNVDPNVIYWQALQLENISFLRLLLRDCKIPLSLDIIYAAIRDASFKNPRTQEIVFYLHEEFKSHSDFPKLMENSFAMFASAVLASDLDKIQALKKLGFDPLARFKGLSVLGTLINIESDKIGPKVIDDFREKITALFPQGVPVAESEHFSETMKHNLRIIMQDKANDPLQRKQQSAPKFMRI